MKAVEVKHHDPNRVRVKKWALCPKCASYTPLYKMQIDHISPVVPTDRTLVDMDANELVDRIWCVVENLQALCPECHRQKSKEENKQRRKKK